MNKQLLKSYRYVPKNQATNNEIEENREFSNKLQEALYNNFTDFYNRLQEALHYNFTSSKIPSPYQSNGEGDKYSPVTVVVDLFGNELTQGFFLKSKDIYVLREIDSFLGGYNKDRSQLRNLFEYIYYQTFRDRYNTDFLIVSRKGLVLPAIMFQTKDDLTIDEDTMTVGFYSTVNEFPESLSPEGVDEREIISLGTTEDIDEVKEQENNAVDDLMSDFLDYPHFREGKL